MTCFESCLSVSLSTCLLLLDSQVFLNQIWHTVPLHWGGAFRQYFSKIAANVAAKMGCLCFCTKLCTHCLCYKLIICATFFPKMVANVASITKSLSWEKLDVGFSTPNYVHTTGTFVPMWPKKNMCNFFPKNGCHSPTPLTLCGCCVGSLSNSMADSLWDKLLWVYRQVGLLETLFYVFSS